MEWEDREGTKIMRESNNETRYNELVETFGPLSGFGENGVLVYEYGTNCVENAARVCKVGVGSGKVFYKIERIVNSHENVVDELNSSIREKY